MIELLLADDEALIRSAMAALLGLEDDIEVIAHFGSGEQLIGAWRQRVEGDQPVAVAVIDLQMPGIDGIDTAIELLSLTPAAGIVIVTSHGRPGYLKRALTAGVRGFLPKTAPAATLADVIRTVHSGGRHIDPQLAVEAISAGDTTLTAREADVLEFAADGASVDEIAARAYLSPGTTRNYLSSAMAKLGASNRYEAALTARRYGWI